MLHWIGWPPRLPRRGGVLGVLGVLAIALLAGSPAAAQIGSDRYASIVTEARQGLIVVSASPDETRHPASLTKMMTVYMAFDALAAGRIAMSDPITVSANAAAMPPSKLGLQPGSRITVQQAILALVTKSANDAAAALGEHLGGGSETRFAQAMTLRARGLGMTRTVFRNASGLPDPDQVTTARDMALLGRRLQADHPDRFAMFATPAFDFRGRTHWNHNRLLTEYPGADGIKTGYINDSGFNLVATAERDGVRLVGVVFGGRSGRERDQHMMAILDQGFAVLGAGPRPALVAAARPVPRLVATARAAPRPITRVAAASRPTVRVAAAPRPPVRVVAAPKPAAKGPPTRTAAAARPPARSAARVEQGDGAGRSTTTRTVATPTRTTTAAVRPAAKAVATPPGKPATVLAVPAPKR